MAGSDTPDARQGIETDVARKMSFGDHLGLDALLEAQEAVGAEPPREEQAPLRPPRRNRGRW